MRILISCIAITSLVLAGCAATPNGDAPRFTGSAVPEKDRALVYLYRVGAYPTRRTPEVTASGVLVYEPLERSYTLVRLSPGKHEFKVTWPSDTGWPTASTSIDLPAGSISYVKVSGDFTVRAVILGNIVADRGSTIQPIRKAEAETELIDCCRYIQPVSGALK